MCAIKWGWPEDTDMVARHLCGNGHLSCVNPSHLAWGTQLQNSEDKHLHNHRPDVWPDMEPEVWDEIQGDPRHPNVIAIHFGVHTALVDQVKLGVRP